MLTRKRKAELRQEALESAAAVVENILSTAQWDYTLEEHQEVDRHMRAIAAGLRRRVRR